MTAQVQVRVLGPLEVRIAGKPRSLGSRLQRKLLTALAIAAGETRSTDQLIDQLWGDGAPPSARNSLQSHVARLRAVVGGDVVLTQAPGYALDTTKVEVDAIAFERTLIAARGHLGEDPLGAARQLDEALRAWRGDAHPEFADDLARSEVVRLTQLRVTARRLLADAWMSSGDPQTAVDTLLRLVTDEPLREDVAVAAARALHSVARTADALDVLRDHRRHLRDHLGLDPGSTAVSLERDLLQGPDGPSGMETAAGPPSPPPAARVHRHVGRVAPPHVPTATIGRQADLQRIEVALTSSSLVTLLGPGGVGKTRLATVSARSLSRRPDRSVAWVDLTRAASGVDVAPVLAEGIGSVVPDRTDPALVAASLARFPGLVVLDNGEHVLDAVAGLIGRALSDEMGVRILVTSRERLGLPAEQVIPVAPLPVPDPDTVTDEDPAVRLFQDRLRAAGGRPISTPQAAAVVKAVDGIPLAIELAAARAVSIGVDELLSRLEQYPDILAGPPRNRTERHRTLTDVITWSHRLLTDDQRAVFRRLSVFASTFRLTDAERVCADVDIDATAVVDAVVGLVERSMVTRDGMETYRLLQPLQIFAARQLDAAPDGAATLARHRSFALELAAHGDAGLTGPEEPRVIAELEAALPDLRAAHGRAVAAGDQSTVALLTGRMYRFAYAQARADVLVWGEVLTDTAEVTSREIEDDHRLRAIASGVPALVWRDRVGEATRRARRYADRLEDGTVDPWAGMTFSETLADLHLGRGELAAAAAAYERGVGFARQLGHTGLIAYNLASLSVARTFQGDWMEGARLASEAVDLATAPPIPTALSLALYARGEARSDNDPEAALADFQDAADEAFRVRARFFEGIARTADVALRGRHGDPDEAMDRYRTALTIWREIGADGMALTTLRNLVVLLVRTGADADAVTLQSALDRLATRPSYGREAERLATALRVAGDRLAPGALRDAHRRGRSLEDLAAAIHFGLTRVDGGTEP